MSNNQNLAEEQLAILSHFKPIPPDGDRVVYGFDGVVDWEETLRRQGIIK